MAVSGNHNWARQIIDYVESLWPVARSILTFFAAHEPTTVERITGTGDASNRLARLATVSSRMEQVMQDISVAADAWVPAESSSQERTNQRYLSHPHQEPIAPPGNKAAHSSGFLLERQMNPLTHDPGLQLLLDVIHRYIQSYPGCEQVMLTKCRFIINFATPLNGRSKSYMVHIAHPVRLPPVEFKREMAEDSLHVQWSVVHNGQSVIIDPHGQSVMIDSNHVPSIPSQDVGENRENRRIEFRDN